MGVGRWPLARRRMCILFDIGYWIFDIGYERQYPVSNIQYLQQKIPPAREGFYWVRVCIPPPALSGSGSRVERSAPLSLLGRLPVQGYFGYWLLVTGYWLLVTGYWLLGV
jgi:hypothetical protein